MLAHPVCAQLLHAPGKWFVKNGHFSVGEPCARSSPQTVFLKITNIYNGTSLFNYQVLQNISTLKEKLKAQWNASIAA